MATNLGKVMITPEGKWIIGKLYKRLSVVTHNDNTYLSLKDTLVEPSDDGENWMLLLEGVPIATEDTPGKVKPDGETITVDEDGTMHGTPQVPESVLFTDDEEPTEEETEVLPRDADTLAGQLPEYYATAEEFNKIVNGDTTVGNADTLDGKHASDFLPITGGTLTNQLGISEPGDTTSTSYLIGANKGITHLVNHNNSTGKRRQISIVPKVLDDDSRYGLRYDFFEDDAWQTEIILHTGNKPTGSYTGNGDATTRTINTGGIGSCVLVDGNGWSSIVSRFGAIYWNYNSTTVASIKMSEVKFEDGKLTIASDSSVINNSGTSYIYQVL